MRGRSSGCMQACTVSIVSPLQSGLRPNSIRARASICTLRSARSMSENPRLATANASSRRSRCRFNACSLSRNAVTSVSIQLLPVSRPFSSVSGAMCAWTTYLVPSLRYLTISSTRLSPRRIADSIRSNCVRCAGRPVSTVRNGRHSTSAAPYPLICWNPAFTHSILPSRSNSMMPLLVRRVTSASRNATDRSRCRRRVVSRSRASIGLKIPTAAAPTPSTITSMNLNGIEAISSSCAACRRTSSAVSSLLRAITSRSARARRPSKSPAAPAGARSSAGPVATIAAVRSIRRCTRGCAACSSFRTSGGEERCVHAPPLPDAICA